MQGSLPFLRGQGMGTNGADLVVAAIEAAEELAPHRRREASGRLWVAFSGGMDSTVLLHALHRWPGIGAAHVNHGIAAESANWARHCRETARGFGVEFRALEVSVDRSGNLEAGSRQARHAALGSLLGQGDVVVLAHHADDQAETRLWQFLTGRHPGGMPATRPLAAGRLTRPLLQVRRAAIASYAKCHGLRWVEDGSNADLSLDRNFIRHRLMPVIEERFPTALRELAAPRAVARSPGPLSATATEQEVRAWLVGAGMPLAKGAVAEIQRQGLAAPDRNPVVRVAPGVCAWRYRQVWRLIRDQAAPTPSEAQAVVPQALALPAGKLSWQRASHGMVTGKALAVHVRSGGETVRTTAGTRRLKALFQQHRVPPWQRPTWPLLYDGDRLLAVPNLALAGSESTSDGWAPIWTPFEQEVGRLGEV